MDSPRALRLFYFAALTRTWTFCAARGRVAAAVLTLGRLAAVRFFALAARLGALPLLSPFSAFYWRVRLRCARHGGADATSPLASTVLFHLGPIAITRPVVTTWAIMLALSGCLLATRRLKLHPDRRQAVLEADRNRIIEQIEGMIRKDPRPFLPLLGTLFIFLVAANLPGYCQASKRRPASSRPRRRWH